LTWSPRPGTPADLDAVFDVRAQAFGIGETDRVRFVQDTPTEGLFVVDAPGVGIVGALRVLPMGQYLGGRRVPMGGVATVVVRPEWRGRGVAARMIDTALAHMRSEGLAVSVLHPATLRPYRRAGWELAGERPRARVPTRALAALTPGEPDRLRRLGRGDIGAIRACYDRVAAGRHGWVDRSEELWRAAEAATFSDLAYAYGVEGDDGTLSGFCRFRLVGHGAGHDRPGHRLVLDDLVAADATAELTLWAFLGGHGMQVGAVEVEGPDTDALALVLGEQDVRHAASLRWMARVVDVPGALGRRGYPAGVRTDLHLHVTDPEAAWNDGPWILTVEEGRGSVRRGGTGALRLGARGLAAAAVGATPAVTLRRAGLLHGGGPDAWSRFDAVFAGPPATMPDHF